MLKFIVLLIINLNAQASCLPELNSLGLDKDTFNCQEDSDCVFVKEACRSCQSPIAVNKKYLKEFTEKDNLMREKIKCVLSCEACSHSQVMVKCDNKICAIRDKNDKK